MDYERKLVYCVSYSDSCRVFLREQAVPTGEALIQPADRKSGSAPFPAPLGLLHSPLLSCPRQGTSSAPVAGSCSQDPSRCSQDPSLQELRCLRRRRELEPIDAPGNKQSKPASSTALPTICARDRPDSCLLLDAGRLESNWSRALPLGASASFFQVQRSY
jgi:hypothetical protein